jgi:prolyl-tRNA editing enzyme YbaK/EbsC (Cys-tRNA(Pro) deacylase)
MSDDVLAYCEALDRLGIGHQRIAHRPIRDYRELLAELRLTPAECVPTLIALADGAPLVIVLRGDHRVDFKGLKKRLAIGDLRLATPEEFAELTGLPPGAARVYNPGMRTVLEAQLLERDWATGGSGDFGCSIRYRTSDLLKIPGSELMEFARESAP